MSLSQRFTLREAAARLSISYRTLWGLVHRGEIPAARVGGRLLLAEDDLERYLAEHRLTVGGAT